jgi:isoleucyl-tRNA synthetase
MADGGDAVAFEDMQSIDQYILARTAELTGKITKAYADFEFHRVYHLLNEFCNSELSAFYLDVLKDRLYTYPIKFKPGHAEQQRLYLARRGAQTAIYKITDALARLTAPILSFTADEVYQSLPHTQGSVHLTLFPTPESLAPMAESRKLIADWETLLSMRTNVLRQLESMRANKEIGKALEAEFELNARYDPAKANASTLTLVRYQAALAELFGLSRVTVTPVDIPYESFAEFAEGHPEKANAPKCDRCWRHVPDVGHNAAYPTVCLRCAEALDAIDFPPYSHKE